MTRSQAPEVGSRFASRGAEPNRRGPEARSDVDAGPSLDWSAVGAPDHLVQFYQSESYLVRVVSGFLASALEEGGSGIVIATDEHRARIGGSLAARGIGVEAAVRDGRLSVLDAKETLAPITVDGEPRWERFREVVGSAVAGLANGGGRVHAFGEMVALLWQRRERSAALRLEDLWNRLAEELPFTLLCAYPIDTLDGWNDAAGHGEICRRHGSILPIEGTAVLAAADARRADHDRAMLAAIVDSSQDAIVSKSLEGVIRSWNAAAEKLFGYTAEEAIGRSVTMIIPPERIDEEAEILARVRRGERIESFETVRVAKDGRRIHVSLTVSPIRDASGALVGASKIARDITERREAAEALRLGEERYHRLTELLPVAVYSCEAPSGAITYYNPRAAEIWGRTPAPGDTDERFCGSLRLFLPDGTLLRHEECPMAIALADGRAFRNQEVIVERPDGRRVPVLVNIDPVRDRTGAVVGAINVFHDVSALKAVESALREQKENLETLLDTLPVAVLIAEDPDCRRIAGNRAAADLLRLPMEANLSKSALPHERPGNFEVRRNGEEVAPENLPIQRAARGETVIGEAVDIVFADGSAIHVLVSARPLFDPEGRSRGAVAAMVDVTDAQRAEAALREADRRKDEFLATLAHELRNPLAPMTTGLELLRTGHLDQGSMRRAREIVERQMDHLTRLVDDLLDVSRITRDKIGLRRELVDIAEVVENAVDQTRPLMDRARHRLTVKLPDERAFIDADPVRIAQVLSNLLNNSAKYTEPGGHISLVAGVEGEELVLTVEDDGTGISAEALPYVFDMFRQGRDARDRGTGGLGVGLTLVRRLVEMHGGTVRASSPGPGLGSRFTVRLPLATQPVGREGAGVEAVASGPSRRILIADDNEDSVFTLSAWLRVKGHTVRTARDGLEAVETARGFRPDVILMDIGMPRLNGLEAARRIRAMPDREQVVILALTGWGQPEDVRRTKEAGCTGHLTKPVNFVELDGILAAID